MLLFFSIVATEQKKLLRRRISIAISSFFYLFTHSLIHSFTHYLTISLSHYLTISLTLSFIANENTAPRSRLSFMPHQRPSIKPTSMMRGTFSLPIQQRIPYQREDSILRASLLHLLVPYLSPSSHRSIASLSPYFASLLELCDSFASLSSTHSSIFLLSYRMIL